MSRIIKKLDSYIEIDRIFSVFKDEENAVFLDSSLQNSLGEFSIIGIHPYLTVINSEKLHVDGEASEMTFEEYMRVYLKENYEENTTDLPLVSGAIGYLSYDYGRELENVETVHQNTTDMPSCFFAFYDDFIIENHKNKEVYLVANGKLIDSGDAIRNMEKMLTELESEEEESLPGQIEVRPNFEKQEYLKAIDRMIQYIIEGDIYIANLTQRLEIRSRKQPYEAFRKLRRINPSPFGAYMNYGDFQIVCASPERFIRMKNGHIETRPIKGTRKKGSTPEEDAALKEELQNSEKDKSELLMIVDLERNDLNKVCKEGSVKVTELFTVEEYATVYHLVSNIVGEIQEGLNAVDLITAAFPGGSITGAPKKRAIEIIDELENGRRDLYTGSLGYISMDGSCDLNIVIRTALYKDGVYSLGVGGGITYESELEFEYEETLQKAKAILDALS
ncbi:aminodeoxychorismate synthase component I [Parasporobacterium paucivorans]|uniref:Anthranilate synthase component 1 n=1 Tax=Parasporobacterium paucivorans DSM 15970 TaxID=1122934 RepID=A0A1M6LK22_9FIRM|nr:aminodeoxychorismate synthase component I [Parasporobacterium paucivorans]SHJ71522.1 para-aminobenzoate synthetase component 1 [Parasporobacterium paucivorans DSM 15970]